MDIISFKPELTYKSPIFAEQKIKRKQTDFTPKQESDLENAIKILNNNLKIAVDLPIAVLPENAPDGSFPKNYLKIKLNYAAAQLDQALTALKKKGLAPDDARSLFNSLDEAIKTIQNDTNQALIISRISPEVVILIPCANLKNITDRLRKVI